MSRISLLMVAAGLIEAAAGPYASCTFVVDALSRYARVPATHDTAIVVLKAIVVGQPQSAAAESTQFQLSTPLSDPGFVAPIVRARAISRLGEIGGAEIIQFLKGAGLDRVGHATDPGQEIWPATRVAIRNAELAAIQDPWARQRYLEETVRQPEDAVSKPAVRTWAIEQICNSGMTTALPIVDNALRQSMDPERADEEVGFCRERMQAVPANANRIEALGSAMTAPSSSDRLRNWAIQQLADIGTPDALGRLAAYAAQISSRGKADARLSELRFRIALILERESSLPHVGFATPPR